MSDAMRRLSLLIVPISAAALLLSAQVATSATGPAEADPAVVRCGQTVVGSRRIAKAFGRLREFQRRTFGNTEQAQLRGYVEHVTVRDAVLAERGRQSGLLDSPRIRVQRQLLLEAALTSRIGEQLGRESPVSDADIKAYYEAHPELFRTPERIRIFRLLVDAEADAAALITKVNQLPSMDDWRNLVREKTKDRATAERGGDLGFVAEDGTTDVPELEVDRALFAAAQSVKDGEVVPRPIAEGKRFAVIWRRGSLLAKTRELASESARIRQQLILERLDRELTTRIAQLRQTHLRDHHPERLNGREFPESRATSENPTTPAPSTSAAK